MTDQDEDILAAVESGLDSIHRPLPSFCLEHRQPVLGFGREFVYAFRIAGRIDDVQMDRAQKQLQVNGDLLDDLRVFEDDLRRVDPQPRGVFGIPDTFNIPVCTTQTIRKPLGAVLLCSRHHEERQICLSARSRAKKSCNPTDRNAASRDPHKSRRLKRDAFDVYGLVAHASTDFPAALSDYGEILLEKRWIDSHRTHANT